MKKALLLIPLIVLSLEIALGQQAGGLKTTEASVVAYDLGVEQVSGLCRQTMIARSEKSKRSQTGRYLIIRRDSSCPELMPDGTLQSDHKRIFNLKRDTKCDQDLQELKYFISLWPTGILTKRPRLKPVRGWKEVKVPAAKKLPCYIMTTSD